MTCFGEGAVALAEFLAENHQIQRLDLCKNEVKLGGLMALSLALKINNSLASLDLDLIPPQEQVGAAIIIVIDLISFGLALSSGHMR